MLKKTHCKFIETLMINFVRFFERITEYIDNNKTIIKAMPFSLCKYTHVNNI